MNKEIEDFLNNQRNLTEEESRACQKGLAKISKPTGVSLDDFLNEVNWINNSICDICGEHCSSMYLNFKTGKQGHKNCI